MRPKNEAAFHCNTLRVHNRFLPLLFITACFGLVIGALPLNAFSQTHSLSLAGRRPNILLILTDDQGYGDLSCHGNPALKTPNLDRLHAESIRFTDFHVSPTCAPTRAALMTGRHEFKSGVTHTIYERERLSLKATTIAQVLRSAGYTTGIFGKWHLGDERDRWPDKRGFDEFFIHGAGGIGQTYPGSCGDAPGNTYFDPVILHNGRFVKTSGYCTDVFFRQARQWLNSVREKPFFICITPNAPHAPLICPEKFERLYAGRVPTNVATFFGMIANIDENVGILLDELKRQSREKETLVIFMNDNGGTAGVKTWNAGMRGSKGTPYLGGTRAAAFFRWPGTLTPGDRRQLAGHIDLFPTLAALAGGKIPDGLNLDGRNLLPFFENATAHWPDRHLFTHLGRWEKGKAADSKYAHCSVRNTNYHLVCDTRDSRKQWQLFDVLNDPGEQRNLAVQRPEIVSAMETVYDQWWADVLPRLENENVTGPALNPFKALYWEQFGGPGPNNVAPPMEGR